MTDDKKSFYIRLFITIISIISVIISYIRIDIIAIASTSSILGVVIAFDAADYLQQDGDNHEKEEIQGSEN